MNPDADRQQQVLHSALLVDLGYLILLAAGVWLLSTAILFIELIRYSFLFVLQYVAFRALCGIQVHQPTLSSFGAGKLERCYYLALGVGLCLGGIWLVSAAPQVYFQAAKPATALQLTLAALLLALKLAATLISYLVVSRHNPATSSSIYRGQLAIWRASLLTALFIQLAITIAALTNDPGVSKALSLFAHVIAAGIMLWMGVRITIDTVPDILDASLDTEQRLQLYDALTTALPEQALVEMRTRGVDDQFFADVVVRAKYIRGISHLLAVQAQVSAVLEKQSQSFDLNLVVETGSREGAS